MRAYHEVLISNLSVSEQYGNRCSEAAGYSNGIGFIDKNGLSDMDIGIKTFEEGKL